MEPDVSVEGAAVIRIVILPVGDISAQAFRDFSNMIMRHKRIGLNSFRSSYTEHQKSPFSHLPWTTGALQFKFVPGHASRSPWEDFQSQRKILGVIGVCHCPRSSDIGDTYKDFVSACKAYPTAQSQRCFAFDPDDDQMGREDGQQPDLVLFPPANPRKLAMMLENMMQEFAVSLLMAFESYVLHVDPIATLLLTPFDSQQASLPAEEVSRTKKRRFARMQKVMGDYCLLAGSPADALSHFATAIELARLTSDHFWLAGALEGSCTAHLVERAAGSRGVENDIRTRYMEAISLYKRSAAIIFEVEASLKLCRFLCRMGREAASEVTNLLSVVTELGKQLPTQSDLLVLYIELARIYAQAGYLRKSAFFSRQVALLYQQQDSQFAAMSALQVLFMVAPAYHVQSVRLENRTALMSSSPDVTSKKDEKAARRLGSKASAVNVDGLWGTLQMDILGDMLAVAVRAGDPLSAWMASACLLRHHYPLITPSGHFALAAALTTSADRLPKGTRSSTPAIPFIRLLGHPSQMLEVQSQILQRELGKEDWWMGSAPSGPFIYTPFTSKGASDKQEVLWVAGEVAQVVVQLSNPCAFEVNVESLFLSIVGAAFEAFPVSLKLPPVTSGVTVALAGVPRSEGPAQLRGCFVRCFGVLTEHLFADIVEVPLASKNATLVDPFRGVPPVELSTDILPPPTSIGVLPQLPLLAANLGADKAAPVVFEGEVRELEVCLTNVGALPVVEAHLSVEGKHRHHVLHVEDTLQDALPLYPGASVIVPVRLRGQFQVAERQDASTGGLRAGMRVGTGSKEDQTALLTIHYAGTSTSPDPADSTGGHTAPTSEPMESKQTLPPGRRLSVPLRLHVQQGLHLVRARLLAMGSPFAMGFTEGQPNNFLQGNNPAASWQEEGMGMALREAKGVHLMELELWNGTDVGFGVSVVRREGKEGAGLPPPGALELASKGITRIDRDCSGRVLFQLDGFMSASLAEELSSSLAASGAEGLRRLKAAASSRSQQAQLTLEERQQLVQLEAIVDELCTQFRVLWVSGRNTHGELQIWDAVRDALEGPAIDILLPDLVTFSFHVNPLPLKGVKTSSAPEGGGKPKELSGDGVSVVARVLTSFELHIRNSSNHTMTMSLSVACRDVSGASCLGPSGTKATILWAGALNGVEASIAAQEEIVHKFSLCFLVPGEYSLLAAAIVEPQSGGENGAQPLPVCHSGLPHKLVVVDSNTVVN